MTRRLTILLFVLVAGTLAGCAHQEKGLADHEERLLLLEETHASLDERVAAMETRMEEFDTASAADVRSMGRGLERVEVRSREMEDRVVDLEQALEEIRSLSMAELRIKALGDNGRMDAARALADKIRDLGYKVERVDLAPRGKRFSKVTVFYQEARRPDAVRLAVALGGDTRLKPLTWHSVFDVIVVTASPPQ